MSLVASTHRTALLAPKQKPAHLPRYILYHSLHDSRMVSLFFFVRICHSLHDSVMVSRSLFYVYVCVLFVCARHAARQLPGVPQRMRRGQEMVNSLCAATILATDATTRSSLCPCISSGCAHHCLSTFRMNLCETITQALSADALPICVRSCRFAAPPDSIPMRFRRCLRDGLCVYHLQHH